MFDRLAAPVGAETVLHFTMPPHGAPESERLNVNYTMFEADRIPAPWVDLAQWHELIVLPGEAGLRAWADSGVPESELRVCSLGVSTAAPRMEFRSEQEFVRLATEDAQRRYPNLRADSAFAKL